MLVLNYLAFMQAADKLDIAMENVLFGYNYVQHNERSFQVDRATYKILDVALHRAHEFCKLHRPLLPYSELMAGNADLEKYRFRSDRAKHKALSNILVLGFVFAVLVSFSHMLGRWQVPQPS